MGTATFNATIIGCQRINEESAIYRIRPDAGVPPFRPGQYLALGVCECCDDEEGPSCERTSCHYSQVPHKLQLVKRAYSIASSPTTSDYLEFYINLLPHGAFTARLAQLRVGARVHVVRKVVGAFTLSETPATDNLVFIATGTGIAPFLSMLREGSVWNHPRATLVHGVRYAADLAYYDELRALESAHEEFSYYPVVSREEGSRDYAHGRVQDVLLSGAVKLDPRGDHVFLCGSPGMAEEIQAILEPHGFKLHTKQEPGNLHMEKYW